jgi:hypothetical protein
MGQSLLTRLLITLVAVVFIGASLPANCADGTIMHDAAAMDAPMDGSCADCPDNDAAPGTAKITCGALACTGISGLPTRHTIALPVMEKFRHPPSGADKLTGISLKPDPFPPRPAIRV